MTAVLRFGPLVLLALGAAPHAVPDRAGVRLPTSTNGVQSLAAVGLPTSRAPNGPFTAVEGTVRFEGSAQAGERIDMSSDPYCARINAASPAVGRSVAVGPDGGLQGVVVSVKGGAAGGARAPAPADTVVLDQTGCMYRPAVLALRVGQPLVIQNSDETLHNVHVRASRNRSFNVGQPRRGLKSRRAFPEPEVGIPVSCDIHGWMTGSISVFDHPYFAVTGTDGSFSIDGLPPGSYVLEAWHPVLGVQTASITVASGQNPRASFVYRGS